MVDLVVLAQVGDHTCEHFRLAVLIPRHPAPAAQPDPGPPHVSGPVLDVVILLTAVGDLLVALQEVQLVVRVDDAAPEGGGILHHLPGQPELFHHVGRIAEAAVLQVADK